MLNRAIYGVLGEEKDLGNKLHTHYVYESDRDTQEKTKKKIESIISNYSDTTLLSLAYDRTTKKLMRELMSLKSEKNWSRIVIKILKGLRKLLQREIEKAKPIPKPTIQNIKKGLMNLPSYHPSDTITLEQKQGRIRVNYLRKRFSPEYDSKILTYYGMYESWRDTQFIFSMNYRKNLFVWEYINVHKKYQGKNIGTKGALSIEKLAKKLGFTRFSVEYPNRAYWINKLKYKIPLDYRIGSGKYQYTLEGYKEV